MCDLGLAERRREKNGLLTSHLTTHLGVVQSHGTDHAKGIEQGRNFDGIGHRVAFGVECHIHVVASGLAGES